MNINISEKAKESIIGNPKEIMIKKVMTRSWAGVFIEPAVYAGKPDDVEDFNRIEVENIIVYVPKEDGLDNNISIDVRGMGPFKKFTVQGL